MREREKEQRREGGKVSYSPYDGHSGVNASCPDTNTTGSASVGDECYL